MGLDPPKNWKVKVNWSRKKYSGRKYSLSSRVRGQVIESGSGRVSESGSGLGSGRSRDPDRVDVDKVNNVVDVDASLYCMPMPNKITFNETFLSLLFEKKKYCCIGNVYRQTTWASCTPSSLCTLSMSGPSTTTWWSWYLNPDPILSSSFDRIKLK